jgi:hypothetical protein
MSCFVEIVVANEILDSANVIRQFLGKRELLTKRETRCLKVQLNRSM